MGFVAAICSALFATSKDLISKRLAFRLDGTTSTFASFAYALPFYVVVLTILYAMGLETFAWTPYFLLLILLRAITDTFAEWMKMSALVHGDLSVVATFFSLSPIFLLLASPLITDDPIGWPEVVAVILTVAGSLLMIYQPAEHGWARQKKGILLACGAAFFFCLNSCFDRLAVQRGTPVFSGFTMTFLSALFLTPFVVVSKERIQSLKGHSGGLAIRGLLEISFMVCKLYALQFMQAPDVVAVQRLSLVLSIIGGRMFFKEKNFRRRLIAGLLIMAGVFAVAWKERNRLENAVTHEAVNAPR